MCPGPERVPVAPAVDPDRASIADRSRDARSAVAAIDVPAPHNAAAAIPGSGTERSRTAADDGRSGRIVAIDCFRGLALTIVLLDHVDWWAQDHVFRAWTPIGLGFSDAAEAFVFLSGVTFGWVYTRRMQDEGFISCQWRAVRRAAAIYAAYVLTSVAVAGLSFAPGAAGFRLRYSLGMPDGESPARILGRAILLEQPYFALGILGLYAVLLPFMPAILSTARRAWWGVLLVSCALYLAVQPGLIGPWGFPDVFRAWHFHPAAWQLLFVAGVLCGFRGRTHGFAVPKRGWVTAVAMAVLLYALLAEKRSWLVATFGWPAMEDWEWLNRLSGWPRTKPTLGPARLLHFGALACVVASFCPGEGARVWRSAIVRPLVNSGRHSLTLYCLGTVLVYLALLAFEYIGTAPEAVLLLGIDACVLQFLAAGGLERRRRNGPVAVSSPAHQ